MAMIINLPARAEDRPDRVLADFEGEDFGQWTVTGEAFGNGPVRPDNNQVRTNIVGFMGRGLASSLSENDGWQARIGALQSPEFIIDRNYLNLLIGGGNHAFRAAVSLWVDGKVARTSAGNDSDELTWVSWDLRDVQGKEAWIGIYDNCIEDEPGYILVDQVTLSDWPRARIGGHVNDAMAQVRREALDAIRRNAPVAAKDPWRPVYHYTPPAQRMNDPNGPGWHNGYHHVFYQHMVFVGSGPARDVHWGHARSRDLVNWETLPLAIPPAYELGELSVFSGNLAWDQNGDPVQFTTMVPYKKDTYRRVWAARPVDDEWIEWEKTPETPSGLVPQGNLARNIKDPFPFSAGDRRFLVLTDHNIPIFEATDDKLTEWVYRGVLDQSSAECPNFFEVDGYWVYLSSPHGPVRYAVGEFDPETAKFTPRTEGYINHHGGFYASTAYRDDKGRTILHGITRGQRGGRGWTGALAMPRVLTIGKDLRPRMYPVPELESLRRESFTIDSPVRLENGAHVVDGLAGDTLEIVARFQVEDAREFGIRVRRSDDGTRSLPVVWRDGRIVIINERDEHPCTYELDPASREVTFRLFLDKGVLDVGTTDGRVFESRIHYAPLEDLGVEVFAEGGSATLLSLEAWQMAPAQIDHSRLFASDLGDR